MVKELFSINSVLVRSRGWSLVKYKNKIYCSKIPCNIVIQRNNTDKNPMEQKEMTLLMLTQNQDSAHC
jgi:hypothetical protein